MSAEKPKVEVDWTHTTLTAEAARSLGIKSAPAQRIAVRDSIKAIGNVQVKQGGEISVTAPVAGYVREPAGRAPLPIPGMKVQANQGLFRIEPILSPIEAIQMSSLRRGVDNELVKARENLQVAQSDFQRMEELQGKGLRGKQDLEQASARLNSAKEDVTAAIDKQRLFGTSTDSQYSVRLPEAPIVAPRAGTVLHVPVGVGQYVAAAAPLVVIADLTEPWVRVAVPEYYLPAIDRSAPATIVLRTPATSNERTAKGNKTSLIAKPVGLVPLVDLARHTADFLYLVPAGDSGIVAKDQTVTVLVPLGSRQEETVVPYSALLFDPYGGAWLYIEQGGRKDGTIAYERRRVEIGPSVDSGVVVRPGCNAGELVVTEGAANLYSREFYKPPVPKP